MGSHWRFLVPIASIAGFCLVAQRGQKMEDCGLAPEWSTTGWPIPSLCSLLSLCCVYEVVLSGFHM
ncbi:hypothetical protein IscW_ISCW006356 [Ixodes scapularis]|uniref:Uncharacterized protein n=1 Tax=Ixodes scapularis TaxID=6945 RepID=B7PL70_IXOSC|nr:hypothetical protein IscW_ISCW006356 [Ixodes scapularis]|eukprot:XP_002434518.1 hypothetical protein IscW_ISCW006356 [Ixodes scapularis]